MSGSAETEVSTPFPAEALAGPTRGSSAACPRPSGGRSPGGQGRGGAAPAALVPAASQRGRVPGQARRPSGPESCVYPGAGGSSAVEIRPTHCFSSQANVPRPANGSARSTRVGGFGPHPERGNAGLPVASFLRRQLEAWRPPLARPRTCSRSEASDATAKAEARSAIAAQHTPTEGRHPRRTGWDPRGKAPSQLLDPRIRQSGKTEWTEAPLASGPQLCSQASRSERLRLVARRGCSLWRPSGRETRTRASRHPPETVTRTRSCSRGPLSHYSTLISIFSSFL